MRPEEWRELPWDVRWRMGVTIGVVLSIGAVVTLFAAVMTGQWIAYVVGGVNALCAINVWRRLYSASQARLPVGRGVKGKTE